MVNFALITNYYLKLLPIKSRVSSSVAEPHIISFGFVLEICSLNVCPIERINQLIKIY